jgi:hypothetical protein
MVPSDKFLNNMLHHLIKCEEVANQFEKALHFMISGITEQSCEIRELEELGSQSVHAPHDRNEDIPTNKRPSKKCRQNTEEKLLMVKWEKLYFFKTKHGSSCSASLEHNSDYHVS